MNKPTLKHDWRLLYSFIVFIVLASLDNAAAGVLPPLYAIISRDLGANDAALGGVTAVYLIIVALSAIYWGYRGDRARRKPLLFYGTLLWGAAMILTALSRSFAWFLLFQMVTAVGVGGISSVGFSVVSDLIPAPRRGMALSLWSISQGIGAAGGALLAGTLGALDWRLPFLVIAGLGFLFAILYLFTREPQRGQSQPELTAVFARGGHYDYRIHRRDIRPILRQRSTFWLLWQSFFYSLAFGSTLWVPRWAIARVQAEGYDLSTATIVGNLFITLFSVGAFFAIAAGHIGDRWQRRNPKGRVYLGLIGLFGAMPFFILLFFTPLKGVEIPADGNFLALVTAVFLNLFTNPWVIFAFLVAFAAIALQSSDPPNWAAMITDVNLPEHRGTVIGISRLFRAVGNALSVGAAGFLITFLAADYPSPDNYAITLAAFQLLVIPAGFCYYKVSKNIVKDRTAVTNTLTARAETAVSP